MAPQSICSSFQPSKFPGQSIWLEEALCPKEPTQNPLFSPASFQVKHLTWGITIVVLVLTLGLAHSTSFAASTVSRSLGVCAFRPKNLLPRRSKRYTLIILTFNPKPYRAPTLNPKP